MLAARSTIHCGVDRRPTRPEGHRFFGEQTSLKWWRQLFGKIASAEQRLDALVGCQCHGACFLSNDTTTLTCATRIELCRLALEPIALKPLYRARYARIAFDKY